MKENTKRRLERILIFANKVKKRTDGIDEEIRLALM